jgi:hypothetical protein
MKKIILFFVFTCIWNTGFSQQSPAALLQAEGIRLKPSNQQFYVADEKYDWGQHYQTIGSRIKGKAGKEDHQRAVKKVRQSRLNTWLGTGLAFGSMLVFIFAEPTAALTVAGVGTGAALGLIYLGAFQNMQAVDHLNSAVWNHNLQLVEGAEQAQTLLIPDTEVK